MIDSDTREVIRYIEKQRKMQNEITNKPIPFKWEQISPDTQRVEVIGGWLVSRYTQNVNGVSEALVFVPDPNHEWRVK